MIQRCRAVFRVKEAFRAHLAVALVGPRQCGKTTLAGVIAGVDGDTVVFDLEKAVDRRRLRAPELTLGSLHGLVVIDEIQRAPELFEVLRVLLDRPDVQTRFLVLGSASPSLIRGVSESLAGRIGIVDLGGFDLSETGANHVSDLWIRGGFPRSFLASDESASLVWRESFVRTFLERDIPQLGITIPSETLRRFWLMIAHYHGQVWNAAYLARSLGAGEGAARHYLDILSGAYMVRVLPPWHENLKKRQVKSPKIYIRDSGLLHSLLEIPDLSGLSGHPKFGASWEGFALEQVVACLQTRTASFWATHSGAELDLMVTVRGKRYGFEFKYADAPGSSRSMRVAMDDLQLEHLWVVYPGDESYALDDRLSVLPAREIPELALSLTSGA
jgi:hypothetical protein